jgi:hypothetical protein
MLDIRLLRTRFLNSDARQWLGPALFRWGPSVKKAKHLHPNFYPARRSIQDAGDYRLVFHCAWLATVLPSALMQSKDPFLSSSNGATRREV